MNHIDKETIKLNPHKEFPVIGLKIVEEQYADDFVNKGSIHFSSPKIWRNPKKCNGKQLDKDDGCFCFSTETNDQVYESLGRKFERIKDKNGWKYFEKNDTIVGTCFYGVLLSTFIDQKSPYGVATIPSKDVIIPSDYFNSFTDVQDKSTQIKTIIVFDLPRLFDL